MKTRHSKVVRRAAAWRISEEAEWQLSGEMKW